MRLDPLPRRRMQTRPLLAVALAALLVGLGADPVRAQVYGPPQPVEPVAPTPAPVSIAGSAETESVMPHDFSFIVMPIPISDPAIGDGLALGAGVFYEAGGSERPWVTGAGGLYTDNGSWTAAVFQKAYIGADRFRLIGGGGIGEFNVDFYGVGPEAGGRGVSIPITQDAGFAIAQGLVRVAPHTYLGLQYRLIDMSTTLDIDPPPFPDMDLPPLELNSRISALGLSGEYDSRDNEYQPNSGLYATAIWLKADEAFGSDHEYSRLELKANGYTRTNERTVWAWRVSTCWAGDGAPFYDICNFGSQSDLRGYVQGQYRDHSMFAIQTEYRRNFGGRFGVVMFAGVGRGGAEVGEMGNDELLPAGGVGVRYLASRKYGVNVGIDYAFGEDSSAVYFRVGEAF